MDRQVPGRPGGITSLVRLLTEHGEALEADFRRYYSGLDIRDLREKYGGPDRVTFRLVRVLYQALPMESATLTAQLAEMTPEQLAEARETQSGHGAWSHTDHLLAAVFDAISGLGWLYAASHAEKGKQPDQPKPMDRPGLVDETPKADPAAVAYLMRIREDLERRQAA